MSLGIDGYAASRRAFGAVLGHRLLMLRRRDRLRWYSK